MFSWRFASFAIILPLFFSYFVGNVSKTYYTSFSFQMEPLVTFWFFWMARSPCQGLLWRTRAVIQLCSLGPSRRAGACRPHPASPWAALSCEFVPVSSVAVPCLVTGAFPCPQVAASSRSFPTVNLPLLSKFRQRITTHRSLLLKQGGLALGSALRTHVLDDFLPEDRSHVCLCCHFILHTQCPAYSPAHYNHCI